MILLVRIIFITYLLSINFYGFMLIRLQKKQITEQNQSITIKDSKLLIVGVLGGALGVLIAMFTLKHRLHSLLLMIFMPILVVLTGYLIIVGIITDFNIF